MPCHTAYHPSDSDISKVKMVRSEGRKLCYHIRTLSVALNSYSEISLHMQATMALLEKPIPLEMVGIAGFDNHTTEHPRIVAAKVKRAGEACMRYTVLFDKLVAEMCRLCVLSEKTKGKFLDDDQAAWWKVHKRSLGHDA